MSINARHSVKTTSIKLRNNDKHPDDGKKSITFGMITIFLVSDFYNLEDIAWPHGDTKLLFE